MIKLVRNTLGDKKILKTRSGTIIKWDHIRKLQKLQNDDGLKARNKLINK